MERENSRTGRNNPSLSPWLPFLILFRFGFRFVTLLDSVLGMVLFYNVPLLLHLPRFVALGYPLIMGIAEVYLMVVLRRGKFPVRLLLAYFIIAVVFEFPAVVIESSYAAIKSGISGILIFVLMWYITAPLGLLLVLTSYRSWKTP
ncbi:hypothetical protein [Thermococcus thermotolerans]|uniref:hypothetical protein n=1 Tax=Thermococcus thermotolerans TaxID=2969672 RepID=UPI0021589AEF|nr:hypothetical protein [Thermococcus thermotolerans]